MDLAQWDREIAPKLRSIKTNARQVVMYAKKVSEAVQELKARPDFETEAEEYMKEAFDSIERANLLLLDARARYAAKEPVT